MTDTTKRRLRRRIEVTTQAQLDKALKNLKPEDWVVCLGGTWDKPLKVYDSASVEAYDSASVEAYDSASVRAYGSASVRAYDSASVEASGSASVRAYDSASVRAYGSASVRAYDSASVRASRYVSVHKHGTNPRVAGGVIIEVPVVDSVEVFLDYYGVEVTRGVAVLFKAVSDQYISSRNFAYLPGTKPKCDDWSPAARCGNGLHFVPRPWMGLEYQPEATRFVACPVEVSELVLIDEGKVKAPRVFGAVYEVDRHGDPV